MANSTAQIETATVDVAGRTLDLSALPARSVSALLSRGLTHYFGSEVSSKVIAERKRRDDAGTPMNDDELTAAKADIVEGFWNRLLEGTIGQRAVAVSVDPIDKIKARLVRESVIRTLKANGIVVPKKDESVTFGDGVTRSMEDMLAKRADTYEQVEGEALDKAAKRVLNEQAKKKEAAEKAAASAASKTADALGL